MGDKADTQRLPSPSSEITFDGNPVELDRLFAHCALQRLLYPLAFTETKTLIGYLLAHFRGPALDWVVKELANDTIAKWTNDYEAYCNRIKSQFGYSLNQAYIIARTRVMALKQTGGMREFILEFDDLTAQAGLTSDIVRTTLAFPKLKKFYQDAWTCDPTKLNATWNSVRTFLLDVASRHEDHGRTEEEARKKSKCGKCGKNGHTSAQCRSSN
jgi:hypothetical protein